MPEIIPEVLFLRAPTASPAPLVLDSPHSGTRYPDEFDYQVPLDLLRKAEDTYVDELYAAAPDLGAAHLGALFPRSYVDVNRGLQELDPGLIEGEWPDPLRASEKADLGVGLIWRKCRPNLDIYGRKLSVTETRTRLDTYWRPYHQTLKRILDETYVKFGAVWHINCHSMPRMSDTLSKEGPGHLRPEFCLGDRRGTTCSPEFLHLVRSTLEGLGYEVALNEPFAGVELVKAYSDPAANRHSLQIEIRRDLYMDEDTFEKAPGFEKLRADLTSLTRAVAARTREWVQ